MWVCATMEGEEDYFQPVHFDKPKRSLQLKREQSWGGNPTMNLLYAVIKRSHGNSTFCTPSLQKKPNRSGMGCVLKPICWNIKILQDKNQMLLLSLASFYFPPGEHSQERGSKIFKGGENELLDVLRECSCQLPIKSCLWKKLSFHFE